MKWIFAGSPEFSVGALQSLVQSGKHIVAVITQPDKPTGRKKILTPTPVKQCALALGLPVYEFDKIRNHIEELRAIGADGMITCAYGQILTQDVLDSFPVGVWNIHASLLPEFRGASPIQSAILAGKTHTGITVMRTELSLDTGDMLLVKRCEIGDKTFGELRDELAVLGAQCAVEAVELLEKGDVNTVLQDEAKATVCKKIGKEDARLDFTKPAEEVLRLIKGMSPEPLAWCMLNGANLNVYNAKLATAEGEFSAGAVVQADKKGIVVACGQGAIAITQAQPAGGKVLSAPDLVNGRKLKVGDILE